MLMFSTLALLALPQVVVTGQKVPGRPGLPPVTREAEPWTASFGGPGADWLTDATPVAGGGVVAAGYTYSFGNGNSDAYVVRADAMGRGLFEFALGGAGSDEIRAVVATPDGGSVMAGLTSSSGAGGTDGWVVKLAADGAVQWQRTYGAAGDEAFQAIAVVPGTTLAPRYYVGGTANFGTNANDAWVLELDAAGTPLWQKTYGAKQDDDFIALAPTTDGLVVVTNSRSPFGGPQVSFTRPWLLRLDAAGEPVVQRTYSYSNGDVLSDIVALEDGTFAVTGEIVAFGFFRGDVWVQRLDANLDVIWDRRLGDHFINYFDGGRRIRALPSGDLLVAGSTATAGAGSDDLWLMRFDGAGNLRGERTFGGRGFDNGLALAVDPNGLAFLGGIIQLPPVGGSFDGFLARVTEESFGTLSGCTPPPPTQPSIWTSALTVGAPAVPSVITSIAPARASATVTPVETGSLQCP
jgi:hypothetical protein